MPTRTKQLALFSQAVTGLTVHYTVPANQTAIVKSITVYRTGVGAVTVTFVCLDGATNRSLYDVVLAPGVTSSLLLPYTVLQPGQQLKVSLSAAIAVDVLVSGVELAGVAP